MLCTIVDIQKIKQTIVCNGSTCKPLVPLSHSLMGNARSCATHVQISLSTFQSILEPYILSAMELNQ